MAARTRYRRSRNQDGKTTGLDDDQEWKLLALAAREFDVFVTVDRNLSFQQNVAALSIAVIVLHERINRLADLRALIAQVLPAITSATPG
ncbi:MAG TPA: hypothetical protein VGI28_08210 [Stellaceae bacterium]